MTPTIDDVRDLYGQFILGIPRDPDPAAPATTTSSASDPSFTEQLQAIQNLNRLMAHQAKALKQLDDYKKKFGEPASSSAPKFFQSQGFRDGLELGIYAFLPYLVPLRKVAESLPEIRPFGLDLSPTSLLSSFRAFQQEAAESAKTFDESIAGAIRNPTSLDDLAKGDLFVIDEDALNEIVASVLEKSPAGKKIKNVKVVIDGDELKISGEYKTALCWVDFKARLELEQKDGKTRGSLRKIEAVGVDLTSIFQDEILAAFQQFDLEPPSDATLKDLSWAHLPGIKCLEIRRDLIILEREPAPSGPT